MLAWASGGVLARGRRSVGTSGVTSSITSVRRSRDVGSPDGKQAETASEKVTVSKARTALIAAATTLGGQVSFGGYASRAW